MSEARILIIEADENTRETMRSALEGPGYQVETAATGREALGKFGSGEDWDLVLLDQHAPGIEGLEVLRRLRQTNDGVPVILMTEHGTLDVARDVMRLGARSFIQKPITMEDLQRLVRETTTRRPAADR
jgi:DNA-binding NtrC family response regulator